MKKKTRKVLALLASMVALVAITIGATVAYLTSTDTVTNIFTVGKVKITLDEAYTTTAGYAFPNEPRRQENEYHLIPGKTYSKDPTVHVETGSSYCVLFVKVENGIADIEATDNPIATQITDNGWRLLTGYTDLYWKTWDSGDALDQVVFEEFTIANTVTNETLASYADAKVVVTAYAVQYEGFDSVGDAWDATFGAPTPTAIPMPG